MFRLDIDDDFLFGFRIDFLMGFIDEGVDGGGVEVFAFEDEGGFIGESSVFDM